MATTRNLGSAFEIARENDQSRIITNPLPGDPSHRVMLCRYYCDVRHWGPGRINDPQKVLGQAHPEYPDVYCVTPDTLERQQDRLVFFTRVFASIPRSWEQVSSAIVNLPGLNQSPTYASGTSITSAFPYSGGVWRLTSASHGLAAGDIVHVGLNVSWIEGGGSFNTTWSGTRYASYGGEFRVIRSTDSSNFDVQLGPAPTDRVGVRQVAVTSGSARKLTSGYTLRPRTTRNVTTRIVHDYFLPGVSAGVPAMSRIPLFTPFAIEQGTETDGIFEDGVLTANTVPTASTYRSMIDNNADVIMDCVLDPYLGPIVDRKTTSYIAQ